MDNTDDFIRPPDQVKTERLLHNNIDNELNLALELSKNEFNLLQERQEQQVNEILQEMTEKRCAQCITIKPKLTKLGLIDKPNSRVYSSLLSIIQLYEEGLITKYSLCKEEYDKMFNILKTIRLTNDELNTLSELIKEEEIL
jgi:hypothetical protein